MFISHETPYKPHLKPTLSWDYPFYELIHLFFSLKPIWGEISVICQLKESCLIGFLMVFYV